MSFKSNIIYLFFIILVFCSCKDSKRHYLYSGNFDYSKELTTHITGSLLYRDLVNYFDGNDCFLINHNLEKFSLAYFDDGTRNEICNFREIDFNQKILDKKNVRSIDQIKFEKMLKIPSCGSANIIFSFSDFHQNMLICSITISDKLISGVEMSNYEVPRYSTEFTFLFVLDKYGKIDKVFEGGILY